MAQEVNFGQNTHTHTNTHTNTQYVECRVYIIDVRRQKVRASQTHICTQDKKGIFWLTPILKESLTTPSHMHTQKNYTDAYIYRVSQKKYLFQILFRHPVEYRINQLST